VDALFAKELYGRGEFAQAAKYFQKMVGATGDGRWTLYQSLAEMYEAWHALNLPEAHKKGLGLLERLAQNAWLNHPLNQSRDLLEKQVSLLEAGKAFLEGKDLGHRRGVGAVARTLLHLGERNIGRSSPPFTPTGPWSSCCRKGFTGMAAWRTSPT
jgi:hypothetical protein